MERVRLNEHQVLTAHDNSACKGRYCSVHNPSPEAEAVGERWWRKDRGMMERICPHGVGHPDRDEIAFRERAGLETEYFGMHGCDGCCLKDSSSSL